MEELFIRYIHFLGIMLLASSLVLEHFLIAPRISTATLRKIAVVDAIYGMSAIIVLLTGASLWLWLGKPPEFYSNNGIFLTKVAIFVLVALLSIYPAIFFISRRKTTSETITIPGKVIIFIRIELLMLLIIPLLAVLMARGYGTL